MYVIKKKIVINTSQLKYVFRLEENTSHVMGQNSLTPYGEQNSLRKQQHELLTHT